jgi:hypothetical protein
LALVQAKRHCACPNQGYAEQLRKFEADMGVKDGRNKFKSIHLAITH